MRADDVELIPMLKAPRAPLDDIRAAASRARPDALCDALCGVMHTGDHDSWEALLSAAPGILKNESSPLGCIGDALLVVAARSCATAFVQDLLAKGVDPETPGAVASAVAPAGEAMREAARYHHLHPQILEALLNARPETAHAVDVLEALTERRNGPGMSFVLNECGANRLVGALSHRFHEAARMTDLHWLQEQYMACVTTQLGHAIADIAELEDSPGAEALEEADEQLSLGL